MEENDTIPTASACPASPASVDMCGLVTENREAEDAAAADRTNESFIRTDDSLITETVYDNSDEEDKDSFLDMDDERVIADWDEPNNDDATPSIADQGDQDDGHAVREESEDKWALSSVASWLSSSPKEETQQSSNPFPVPDLQLQFKPSEGDCVVEKDKRCDDDDEVSLGSVSLASILSSIGYISAGSKASSLSKKSVGARSSSRPEAHLLNLPDNLLLDDISTGSVELLFHDDDISISPSLAAADDIQECDQAGATYPASGERENTDAAFKLQAGVSQTNSTQDADENGPCSSPRAATKQSSHHSSDYPFPIEPITLLTEPSIVSENSSIGKDGWGSDNGSVDIENCASKEMPRRHSDTNKPNDSNKTPKSLLLLDTSDDTASTTNDQQSYEDDSSSKICIESPKSICQLCNQWYKHVLCYSVFLGIFVSLMSVLSRNHNDGHATWNAATVESTDMVPSSLPSSGPSVVPSTSLAPSSVPSGLPSTIPSNLPSSLPSSIPTSAPTNSPSTNPTYQELETIFYAIGDVPYNNIEKVQLRERMSQLPSNGEFLIHVGDIRSGQFPNNPCQREEYMDVRDILLRSEIPVFIIPGDNEWSDCPNTIEAQSYWMEAFHEFDKNWDHSFSVKRHPNRPENFHFVHKRTLYFGLNLVGGDIKDRSAHAIQLKEQYDWVEEIMDKHVVHNDTLSVVIFGHAFPRMVHEPFFAPLRTYIRGRLKDDVPIMYLNGDYHFYDFQEKYMGLTSMQRLQLEFGTVHPPMKVAVSVSGDPSWDKTFSHDRML